MKINKEYPSLSTGMMVQLADGDIGMVFGHLILFMIDGKAEILELSDYNNNLECLNTSDYNIQRATYIHSDSYILNPEEWSEKGFDSMTLWTRKPETIEIPMNTKSSMAFTAIVSSDEVTIGPNTFPISVFQKIVDAANEL